MSILVFGHKNPDTDTICSAIAYAELKGKLGKDVKAVRLGEVNEETKFVLDYFKVEKPELIESVSGKEIMLVDHNERTQTADGFEEAKVLELVDHHRISNFNVDEPLYVRMEPVGCTATILFKMFRENSIEIPKNIALAMLSAIISDSLLFKSPTCTDEDKKVAAELEKIAGINKEEYGMEMLVAGTSMSKENMKEIIKDNLENASYEVERATGIKNYEINEEKISRGDLKALCNVIENDDIYSERDIKKDILANELLHNDKLEKKPKNFQKVYDEFEQEKSYFLEKANLNENLEKNLLEKI